MNEPKEEESEEEEQEEETRHEVEGEEDEWRRMRKRRRRKQKRGRGERLPIGRDSNRWMRVRRSKNEGISFDEAGNILNGNRHYVPAWHNI